MQIERVADCDNHLVEIPIWGVESGRFYGAGGLNRVGGLNIRGVR